MEHSTDFAAAADDGSDGALRKQVDELKAKLAVYEKLEEDLMAQRVFVKARRQLTTWITVGGLVAFTVGFVGFRQVMDYAHRQVNDRVGKITDAEVKHAMDDQIARRVEPVATELTVIQVRWQQQLSRLSQQIPPKGTQAVAAGGVALPATTGRAQLDDTPLMTPVRDQGTEGSVVGFAVAAALEYQVRKDEQRAVVVSPRYLYYFARKAAGVDPHVDGGANISDAITVLRKQGAVAESAWPYKSGDLAGNPPAGVASARHYRVRTAVHLKGPTQIKAALQKYGPVVIGLTVYQSLMSKSVAKTGVVPDPAPADSLIGGHAVCIVGYDDATKRFKFKNSWGSGWGEHGYGTVSYRYVQRYGNDAWAISL